jgi:hypothetical protein
MEAVHLRCGPNKTRKRVETFEGTASNKEFTASNKEFTASNKEFTASNKEFTASTRNSQHQQGTAGFI